MDARKLVLPAAALIGGAVLGRLVGFKGLVRIGMAALTLANVSETAGLIAPGRKAANGKSRRRTTRKRASSRKSPARKVASLPAGAQTH